MVFPDNITEAKGKSLAETESSTPTSAKIQDGVGLRKVGQEITNLKPTKPIWIQRSSCSKDPSHEASSVKDKSRDETMKTISVADRTTIKLSNQFSALDEDCAG